MKIRFNSILVLLATIAISACNSIPVSQDFEQGFDLSGFKTFSWRSNDDNSWGLDNELVDRRIRNAIVNTLTSKQYTLEQTDTPDFFVSYNLVVEQRVTGSNLSGGVSMGRSTRGRSASIGLSTGSQVRTYERGTLLIDIHDAASNLHVWRGVSAQALPDLTDPERLTAHINATVEAILKQFPPE
ncbi:MAG: DUF4136 domain-containing protein [Gammaproteobacteria bacterium]|nr:DUF4136 domain-containing protein [Gammaproteobacteria bacterium]MBT8134813.1 DUF4136 domain-containing protein [Gammaproteobacteria bacterium]NNJ51428.1 DUF4136 domain-containing protein [Gammaproteobacteria bacterium]